MENNQQNQIINNNPKPLSSLLDNHLTIVGSTDSGKSTMLEYLFNKCKYRCLFYDQQHERTTGHFLKDYMGGRKALTQSDLQKYKKILMYSPFHMVDRQREIEHIRQLLFKIGKIINHPREIWFVLFVSEAHRLAPKHDSESALNWIATEGKRWGISLVCDTQRPSLLSNTILSQAKHTIYFRLKNQEYPYIREFRIPIDDFKEHINQDYHFVLMDAKDNITKYNPLNFEETKRR